MLIVDQAVIIVLSPGHKKIPGKFSQSSEIIPYVKKISSMCVYMLGFNENNAGLGKYSRSYYF